MISLDKTIGSLLMGTYGNSFLFIVELLQVSHYFQKRFQDPIAVKILVAFIFFIDVIGTLSSYACVYLYSVAYWGNANYLRYQNWTIVSHLITTGITAAVVQTFMVYRYWRFTRNHFICALLALPIITAIAGATGTAADIIKHWEFSQRKSAGVYVTLWLAASTTADVGIAVTLVWRLVRANISTAPEQSLIKRLITSTISTGTTTSIIAIFALFAYLHEPQSNVVIGVTFLLGRVYACTLMYTLNNRKELEEEGARDYHCMTFGLEGIIIQREAVIVHDIRSRSNSATSQQKRSSKLRPPAIVLNGSSIDLEKNADCSDIARAATPFSDLLPFEDEMPGRDSDSSWASDSDSTVTPSFDRADSNFS